jgi:hypothetical protein
VLAVHDGGDYVLWAVVRLNRDLPTPRYDVHINHQPDLGSMYHVKHSRHCFTREIQGEASLFPGSTVEVELVHFQHRRRLDAARARMLRVHGQTPSPDRFRSAERRLGCF